MKTVIGISQKNKTPVTDSQHGACTTDLKYKTKQTHTTDTHTSSYSNQQHLLQIISAFCTVIHSEMLQLITPAQLSEELLLVGRCKGINMISKAFYRLMLTENLTKTAFSTLGSTLKDKTVCEVSKCKHVVGQGVFSFRVVPANLHPILHVWPSIIHSAVLHRDSLLHFIHLG